ncbi:MAG: glutamine amidotransferase [Candidatus Saccharimonas sp.]
MNKTEVNILQLYPRDMSIYGDWGNALVLKRRLEWYGYNPVLLTYNPGDTLPADIDIVIGGGGQDSGQLTITQDLQKIGPKLRELADADVPMLMVCGLYQLFGHSFTTIDGDVIPGINLLDIETHASNERMTGNLVTNSSEFGEIIGFENHSGQTMLGQNVKPLAKVVKGAGNNGRDSTEGARYRNVIGTYTHGPLLPKNPLIADWIIEKAVTRKFGEFKSKELKNHYTNLARNIAKRRPR